MSKRSKAKKKTLTKDEQKTTVLKSKSNKKIYTHGIIFIFFIIASIAWFINHPTVTQGEVIKESHTPSEAITIGGKHVIVNLTTMTLDLRDGTTTLVTLPVLSKGRPGTYFETIGGIHYSSWKTKLHFSSIGHVYMPYSIHVFGNYFIHGIPYYPEGEQVSSTYSGGCIRLSDENAKIVYDFVSKGTPIIITLDTISSFYPTTSTSTTFLSDSLTNNMVAIVSLEALTQDNEIMSTDGVTPTTRKKLLPKLLVDGDTSVSNLYARTLGEDRFVELMNQKKDALGMANTHFTDAASPVATTEEDYARLMMYVDTYKSYLKTIQ